MGGRRLIPRSTTQNHSQCPRATNGASTVSSSRSAKSRFYGHAFGASAHGDDEGSRPRDRSGLRG